MPHPSAPTARSQLLDAYPLIRARSAEQAREQVGRVLSPHALHVGAGAERFEARHNRLRLERVAINVLSYGAEVEIDPGERGDFYLLQLPLRGRAQLCCDDQEAWVDAGRMGVLPPRARTRMHWSGDCAMVMLQVPRGALAAPDSGAADGLRLSRSRAEPEVAAWWQAATDLTRNLHSHGALWLRHPAACTAMEEFLLHGLQLLREDAEPAAAGATTGGTPRHLQRALDYIHAHAHEGLRLADIAQAACVSPRTLEASFRRHVDATPLAYARGVRLDRVHAALQQATHAGLPVSVTDLALQHGFVHMGRFAAYYRQRFGHAPSAQLRSR